MDGSCFLGSMMKLLLGVTFIHTISLSFAITNITTDKSALLALKSHITYDPQNILASNWSSSTPVCNWVGVTCSLRHPRVTILNLSSFGLRGTIPPHLGNLSFLAVLNFRKNSFYGSLPIELTRLRRLKFIHLGHNNFNGEIPLFGSFPKLQVLFSCCNQFSGSIPTSIFNSSTSLEIIDLSENLLSGSIPKEIGNATILNALDLHENKLTGAIPSVLFNMSHLKILWLGHNNFDSSDFPENICKNLPNLENLYMPNNNLWGRIPSQLSQCGNLRSLVLSFNNFVGSIPRTIGNLTNLKRLYLGHNNLTGILGHLGWFFFFGRPSRAGIREKGFCGSESFRSFDKAERLVVVSPFGGVGKSCSFSSIASVYTGCCHLIGLGVVDNFPTGGVGGFWSSWWLFTVYRTMLHFVLKVLFVTIL